MNFVLYQKSYDFYLYLSKIIRYFPKSEKFIISSQIKNKMLDFIGAVIKANKQRDKRESMLESDILLEQLKTLIRLSKDLEYMKEAQYENCCKALSEIGKILGGWIKSCG